MAFAMLWITVGLTVVEAPAARSAQPMVVPHLFVTTSVSVTPPPFASAPPLPLMPSVGDLLGAFQLFADQGKPPCAIGAPCDTVALADWSGQFMVLGSLSPSPALTTFYFGNPGDIPLMGDWNCNGEDTPGMYRPSNGFVYLRNSNTQGVAEVSYYYGDPADIPLAGDFNGDGCDTLSIYRPSEGRVYIKNSLGTGAADYSYYFGNPGDKPFVGDFDGDRIDTIGLHRESSGFVYFRNSHTTGPADFAFYYGEPGDRMLAGDWDANGTDTLAVYRPSTGQLFVRLSNSQGVADYTLQVGPTQAVLRAGCG